MKVDSLREDVSTEEHAHKSSFPIVDEEKDVPNLVPNANEVQEDEGKEHKPYLVTWDENDAHECPRNWSPRYRMFMVFVVSLYTLLMPICSTMNAPALDTLKEEFHVRSAPLTNMMMSTTVLAFTVAPMIYGPMSERVGRKYILQVSNIMYVRLLTQISPVQCWEWTLSKCAADDHLTLLCWVCGVCTCCHWCRDHCRPVCP